VFTLNEGPGVLFKALAVFALRDINLSKVIYVKKFSSCKSISMHDYYRTLNIVYIWKQIESRPQRNRPLRVVDDSNTGTAKWVLPFHITAIGHSFSSYCFMQYLVHPSFSLWSVETLSNFLSSPKLFSVVYVQLLFSSIHVLNNLG